MILFCSAYGIDISHDYLSDDVVTSLADIFFFFIYFNFCPWFRSGLDQSRLWLNGPYYQQHGLLPRSYCHTHYPTHPIIFMGLIVLSLSDVSFCCCCVTSVLRLLLDIVISKLTLTWIMLVLFSSKRLRISRSDYEMYVR